MANLKSKPKAWQKKRAPAGEKRESTEEAPPASVPQSAFSVGDWVHHAMFGDGKIESITDDKLTITFEGNVTKEIRDGQGLAQVRMRRPRGTGSLHFCDAAVVDLRDKRVLHMPFDDDLLG
jgi:hypothetical protein